MVNEFFTNVCSLNNNLIPLLGAVIHTGDCSTDWTQMTSGTNILQYKYIEIYYHSTNDYKNFIRIYNNNAQSTNVMVLYVADSSFLYGTVGFSNVSIVKSTTDITVEMVIGYT